MCSTTGPKIFGPPTGVVSGGTFAPPTNYASNPQATANVGGAPPATLSAPPPAPPVTPPSGVDPQSQLKRASQNPFTYSWGGGGAAGHGRGPISRLYSQ